ncbi:MAG TPA: hypothetical protein VFI74_04015 [Candidatus Saccharimonadales bacterium]|nr:hypothetical protein [Candidatus Saccharimonadales bacterium]
MTEKHNKEADDMHKESLLEPFESEDTIPSDEAQHPKPEAVPPLPHHGKFAGFWIGFWRQKKWTLPLSIITLLAILLAIPATRYPLLAIGIKKTYTITITDSTTHTAVSGARVMLDGRTASTDNKGRVSIKASVGDHTVAITKKYYKSYERHIFVGLSGSHQQKIALVASGRQVPLTIINRITKKPVENAEITVLDTTAKTDSNGKAVIVLPTLAPTQKATITASGYNDTTANLRVTSDVTDANTIALTPSGRVYFLSNLSGTMDVVSTRYDGSDRKVVLAGTGKEDATSTVLRASNDWHYLVLLSKRDGGQYSKLFLIDTTTDKLTTIDEGEASFTMVGWAGDRFVYTVSRDTYKEWQPKRNALKSYDVPSKKITTLDETAADGSSASLYAAESISPSVQISGNSIVYAFVWHPGYYTGLLNGKSDTIRQINADGSGKKTLKDFGRSSTASYAYVNMYTYRPGLIRISIESTSSSAYTYQIGGSVKDAPDLKNNFYADAHPYQTSPAGDKTFWAEARDGKQTLFVGDAKAENGKQIATLTEYYAYGWANDKYLLVSKNNTDLYILPVSGGDALKVADMYPAPTVY